MGRAPSSGWQPRGGKRKRAPCGHHRTFRITMCSGTRRPTWQKATSPEKPPSPHQHLKRPLPFCLLPPHLHPHGTGRACSTPQHRRWTTLRHTAAREPPDKEAPKGSPCCLRIDRHPHPPSLRLVPHRAVRAPSSSALENATRPRALVHSTHRTEPPQARRKQRATAVWGGPRHSPGASRREKKKRKVFLYTVFPKRLRVAHMFNHGLVAVGVRGWWRLAVGSWQLAVGDGWWLVTGGWWRVAGGSGWRLAVGGWSPLAVGGGWWLAAVGRWWRLVVPWGGP